MHTCALRTDGTLACWGSNTSGQATPPAGTFTQIAAGNFHSCGLRTDGTPVCWGSNTYGQTTPPAGTFTQITAGYFHSCGLRTNGTLACWGSNTYGQSTPPAGTFTQVDAGNFHSCGLRTDGTLACWGPNNYGESIPPAGTFAQLAAGGSHTCGLRTDGTLACWGWNAHGQSTPLAGTFTQVAAGGTQNCAVRTDGTLACWGRDTYNQSTPLAGAFGRPRVDAGVFHTCEQLIDGSLTCWGSNSSGQSTPPAGAFTQVTAGLGHTCGLRSDGTLACWGFNGSGQSTPPAGAFTQVVAGYEHTCGLRTDGTLPCWGDNTAGKSTPPAGTFTQVASGDFHGCALRTDGTLACWGSSGRGQVTPPTGTFTQLAAGSYHNCGLRTDGTLACWGKNDNDESTPPAGTFTQVAAGHGHSCGLRTGGTLACWGDNAQSQSTPPAGTFTQVVAGTLHTCGVRTGGMVICWGNNEQGRSATVGFEKSSSSGAESIATASMDVVLNPASAKVVTVRYATEKGTAFAGSDYVARSGILTFSPGQTRKTINVPIVNNTVQEPSERFRVTLSNPVNAYLWPETFAYSILDDDSYGAIKLSAAAYSVGEAGPRVTVTAQRIGGGNGAVGVNYTTANGTATDGGDYGERSGILSWQAGEKDSKTFDVQIINDALDEPNERFTVRLYAPWGNALLGSPSEGTVTITDNDPAPVVRFSEAASSDAEAHSAPQLELALSARSDKTVTVKYATANGTAVREAFYQDGSADYLSSSGLVTFHPGETFKLLPNLEVQHDVRDEPDETFTVSLSKPMNAALGVPYTHIHTILDDDAPPTVGFRRESSSGAESTTTAAFEVILSSYSSKPVTVKYATANENASSGSDFMARSGILTFSPLQRSKTITVPIINNTAAESKESFTVTLSTPVNATLSRYAVHTYTIEDEDTNGAIKLGAAVYSVSEAGPVATLTAQRLGGSSGNVSVTYATRGGSAVADSDYFTRSGTLSWTEGDRTGKSFTVPIANDALDESNEWFTVTLSPLTYGAVLGSPSAATVTINDNDPTPAMRFTTASSSNTESLTPAAIAVGLSAASGNVVRVKYTTADGTAVAVTDYEKTSGTLTFLPGETSKTIYARIFNDAAAEPNQTFSVVLSSPTNAILGSPARHVYTIMNDDAVAPDPGAAAPQAADATQPVAAAPNPARLAANDFDGDGRSDLGVYGAAAGTWTVRLSTGGETTVQLGAEGAVPMTGDFDGDGRSDAGVYDAAAGIWTLRLSAEGETALQLGSEGAVPVTGDFDGDGRSDAGVYDAVAGTWTLRLSAEGEAGLQLGAEGAVPVTGDFDGDGRSDIGIFDAATGTWNLRLSGGGESTLQLGSEGAVPMSGDFDGDGIDDCGCYLPASGIWEIALSSGGRRTEALGCPDAIPIVGDYDGDGTDDIGCYIPSRPGEAEGEPEAPGSWLILRSADGLLAETGGNPGAIPIGSAIR